MKIALIGYGKMGHMIEQIALERGHEIVCKIDKDNQKDFDSPAFATADVAIEFTTPTAAYDNYLKAFAHNVKVVSGSTGWQHEHKADIERLCTEGGQTLFWASNFSIGVAIFSAVNRYLAKIMNNYPQYDVTMQETHHIHKLDAPSGTAITLAEDILTNIARKTKWEKENKLQLMVRLSLLKRWLLMFSLLILFVKAKFLVFIVYATILMPTKLPLHTMRTIERALL